MSAKEIAKRNDLLRQSVPSLDDFRNFLISEELNAELQEYALMES